MEIESGELYKSIQSNYPPQGPPKNLRQYQAEKSTEDNRPDINSDKTAAGEKIPDKDIEMLCPKCNLTGNPNVVRKMGVAAWTVFLVLCCFCFPFCFIPLLFNPCKDSYYYCRCCGNLISIKPP